MAILPLQLARVSNFLRGTVSLSSMAATQRQLLQVQTQLATGLRFSAASEDPGAATVAIQLQRTLERRQAHAANLDTAKSRLGMIDSTLGDVTELLQRAQSLASANVGSDVSADQRRGSASVARSMLSQMLTLANRASNGHHLFAGDRGAGPPYVESASGVRFTGSGTVLHNTIDDGVNFPIGVDGAGVFGGVSSRVRGVDVTPALTPSTRLSDINGALGRGIRLGQISLSNGAVTREVNLQGADTVADVLGALNATGIVTAATSGDRIIVTPVGTGNLTIREIGGNFTARDLGIEAPSPLGPGVPRIGDRIAPKVTPLTPVSALRGGLGLPTGSSIIISNRSGGTIVSFTGVVTVQDLLNRINSSGAGALARINEVGNGIDIVNSVQGDTMTIGENGGVMAGALGVRSYTTATLLSELNDGRGVQTAAGADLRLTARNGATVDVDLDGSVTVQDVINRINAAGTGLVSASFASTGNGIVITDLSGGSGPLSVQSSNFSTAAADLGIQGTVPGGSITGVDVNAIRTGGVFDNLLRLATALESSDPREITRAAEGLRTDLERIAAVRGATGARVRELEDRAGSLEQQNLATQSLLSEIRDTDYSAAITRFQILQTTLQANYQTTARLSQLSLMDFLR